MMQNQSI